MTQNMAVIFFSNDHTDAKHSQSEKQINEFAKVAKGLGIDISDHPKYCHPDRNSLIEIPKYFFHPDDLKNEDTIIYRNWNYSLELGPDFVWIIPGKPQKIFLISPEKVIS